MPVYSLALRHLDTWQLSTKQDDKISSGANSFHVCYSSLRTFTSILLLSFLEKKILLFFIKQQLCLFVLFAFCFLLRAFSCRMQNRRELRLHLLLARTDPWIKRPHAHFSISRTRHRQIFLHLLRCLKSRNPSREHAFSFSCKLCALAYFEKVCNEQTF